MTLQTWIAAGAILGVLSSALVLAGLIGRPLRKLARQNDEFRQDWYGMPARPGRPRVLGVPERLSRLEEQRDGRDGALAQAVAALRDDVGATLLRVETRLDDHIRTHHKGGTA